MLILLDENLPHSLRLLIPDHEIRTVAYQDWASLKNGELLKAAEEAGFPVMITADQSIAYQQNLQGRRIALVVLSSNQRELVTKCLPQIANALDAVYPGSYAFLEIN